jgi:AraC family transcriptional regulator, transcriptional activator of pobA
MPVLDFNPSPGTVVQFPFSGYQQGHRRPGAFHVFRYEESSDPRYVRAQPHRHDFYQLLWLDKGKGQLVNDFEELPFENNTLAFFAPGRLHAWKHEAEPTGIMFGFTPDFFYANADDPGLLGRLNYLYGTSPILQLNGRSAKEMSQWFALLYEEAGHSLPGRDDIVRALITIILTRGRQHHDSNHAVTQCVSQGANNTDNASGSLLVQRFRVALEQHFPKLLKVSEYVRILRVSRTLLNQELHTVLGQTASDIIHDRLLLEAKRLLVHSRSQSIAEIAYHLQFRDPSYFGRFFRQRTGVSPGAYREQECARQIES